MNVTNLIFYLRSKIGDFTLDQQMLSKAIRLLQLGAINSVSSFSGLPNAATSRKDELYLVEFDGIYKNDGGAWVPFVQNFSPALAWGIGTYGRLGDNTTVSRSSPVSVVGFADWCQVSAGCIHTLAVRQNGTAWAWGSNSGNQLGDNTGAGRSSPVSVVGGFTDWCQVSAGCRHSLGVRRNGTAWAWGTGLSGQLGDGTTATKCSAVSVVGGFSDWCQLSGGTDFSLGVRQNGSAWAWGTATFGILGDNSTVSKTSPVSVVGGFTDWCQVSAGCRHSLGVRRNGTAWAWGYNLCGRLGDGGVTSRLSPVTVAGGFTDWCGVSAGTSHSLGVRQNGTAWAWGCNGSGRLGDNTTTDRSSPVSVIGGFTDWCQVSAGNIHSLGVRTNGTAWAWGRNNSGQLGDNTTTDRSSPVSVIGGFTDWCSVSSGDSHSIAIRKLQL
jgi:alpha-tubulin suppressor-like RCC1 family protein